MLQTRRGRGEGAGWPGLRADQQKAGRESLSPESLSQQHWAVGPCGPGFPTPGLFRSLTSQWPREESRKPTNVRKGDHLLLSPPVSHRTTLSREPPARPILPPVATPGSSSVPLTLMVRKFFSVSTLGPGHQNHILKRINMQKVLRTVPATYEGSMSVYRSSWNHVYVSAHVGQC